MTSSIVIIGPPEALPALRERLDSGADLSTFTDADALEALDHIIRHKPRIVAIEDAFSSSSRGTALINRIKDDPSLSTCEVRVVAHDTTITRLAAKRGQGPAAIAVDEPRPALDQRGTRRAPRVRVADGVEILVDGAAATLIDVSAVGVQVLCAGVLKPNQRVRVALQDALGVIRCMGTVAWASFEMPKGQPTRYRAGIDLTSADAEALTAFGERHRKR